MKEYCIFNLDGTLSFTVNTLNGLDKYVNNSNYIIVENDKLDPYYSYTLVNGVIVKGEQWPIPEPPTE
jgi:hypothetical protein